MIPRRYIPFESVHCPGRGIGRPAWLVLFVLLMGTAAAAAEVNVRAVVDRREVFLGEPFRLRIHVEGVEKARDPDVSGLEEFEVEELGGRQNSSYSISFVNGKMNRRASHEYVFSYRLTPRRAGRLTVPSISVSAAGRTLHTGPVSILVKEPEENDSFKLRLTLSEETAYVGQPVILTVTWYLNRDVRDLRFNLPVAEQPEFTVVDRAVQDDANGDFLTIPLGNKTVTARKSRANLDGRSYTGLSFRKVLIPRKSGDFVLPRATVTCRALEGYRPSGRQPSDDFFSDDFFSDMFKPGREEVYRTYSTPSNRPRLRVLPLPETGRPEEFSGLVGGYRLSARAEPLEVNVGDPITLTVTVAGPPYLEDVRLPALAGLPGFARDFKIPAEAAPGRVKDGGKTFIRTIRARHENVREIPPIRLNYFDPAAGRYETAATHPIPLRVRPTRVLTVDDVVGGDRAPVSAAPVSDAGGIAHNYGTNELFAGYDGMAGRRWFVFLGIPPLLFFLLLLGRLAARARRSGRKPAAVHPLSSFRRELDHLEAADPGEMADPAGRLLSALRDYLGGRLGRPGATLTFQEVEERLRKQRVDRSLVKELAEVFEWSEELHYTGGRPDRETLAAMLRKSRRAVEKLERSLP